MSGAARFVAVVVLVLSGACVSTDEQGSRLRRVGPALGQSSGDGNACGSVTYEGCCLGDTLYYCTGDQVVSVDCSQNPSCGWESSTGWYNCGTGGQADPNGTHPQACDFGDAGPPNPVYSCGTITFEGCCHGTTLYYCENGLQTLNCTINLDCGWVAGQDYYDCGTNGQADPSGTYPKACAFDASVPDLGPPIPCGNVTWQGCCDGETLKRCWDGTLFVQDCADFPFCGWNNLDAYACAQDGKADPSGTHPKACAVLLDATAPDGAVPCGDVTWQGCCDGELMYYCQNGLQVLDCHRMPSCGWQGAGSVYDCRTDGAADPKGLNPKACDFGDAGPPVVANTCGNLTWQGCCGGQTVYYCDAGTLKSEDCGKTPYCGWKTDGAYSFYACGTAGQADPSGQLPKACPSDAGVPDVSLLDASPACGPVTHQGCCEGETLYWCAAGILNSMDCSKSPSCGWQPGAEYYDCSTDGIADPLGAHPMACGFDGGAPVLDRGQPLDARPPQDRSIHDTAAGPAPTDRGCGCALVPRSPGGVTLLLLLALVVTLRRRPN